MRIVVFTGLPGFESTPWWTEVTNAPGLTGVLVVQKTASRKPTAVARRFWRNVRKHGWLFVPYRAAVFVGSLGARLFGRETAHAAGTASTSIEVRTLRTLDMHHPFVLETVQDWNPDLGISVGAPILKPELFDIPRVGTLNVHLGSVPDFRGAPPGFWEIWFGAAEIGATVHWVNAGLDTGAVMECGSAPIYEHDTLQRVEARAAELAYPLLGSAIRRVAVGDVRGSPQQPDGHTHRIPMLMQRFALWRRLLWRRARARAADPLALAKLAVAFAWLTYWRPVRDLLRTIFGRHPVRVFTYHRVTDLCRDGMTVPAATFRRQLEYLRRHHTVVDLDQALELLEPGRRLHQPVAAITFDDGYQSVSRVAQPAMNTLNLQGACFVCTDVVGTDLRFDHDSASSVRASIGVMDWGELEALQNAGWRVGTHTKSHTRLSTLDGATLTREVSDPLPALRERLAVSRAVMAYPFGGLADITPEGILAAKSAGYSALASNCGGENFPGDDPFALKRIDVGGDHDTLMWKVSMHGLDLGSWRRRLRRDSARAPVSSHGERLHATASERRPLRVTQIVFDLEGGGMETLVAAMAARWSNTDVRLSVITLSGRVGRVGAKVRPLVEQFHVPRLTPGVSMIAPKELIRVLRATRPDIVHVHTGAWLKGAYAAKLARVPRVVYTEHGREHNDPALTRLQDRVAALCTDRVVAVSDRLREYMVDAVGVSANKVLTIVNGVDTDLFSPGGADASMRCELDIPENALVLGSVGRLESVKAYERLVAAYAELRRSDFGRPLILVIFGEGSDRQAIEREIGRLGVRDGVRLPGWTDRPADGYRLFDVFAMTSTSEGMSVSLMEAMACGVCPVVTDVGSNAEVMGPELRHHVVPAGNHEQFVAAVRRALESLTDRECARAIARREAVERHGITRMVDEYERVYRTESTAG